MAKFYAKERGEIRRSRKSASKELGEVRALIYFLHRQ